MLYKVIIQFSKDTGRDIYWLERLCYYALLLPQYCQSSKLSVSQLEDLITFRSAHITTPTFKHLRYHWHIIYNLTLGHRMDTDVSTSGELSRKPFRLWESRYGNLNNLCFFIISDAVLFAQPMIDKCSHMVCSLNQSYARLSATCVSLSIRDKMSRCYQAASER